MLYVDTETFSTVDLKTAGTVKYAASAELLLAGFKLDNVYEVWDAYHNPTPPDWVVEYIEDGFVCAHNALFDYVVLKKHFPELGLNQMVDNMAVCAAAGLPLGLEMAGKALHILDNHLKSKEGKRLIKMFCMPRKPTKNNDAVRIYPDDKPEEWKMFRDVYLYQDVISLEVINKMLPPLRRFEQEVWWETQLINMEGIPIDTKMVMNILASLDEFVDERASEFIRLTGIFPTQRDKVLNWCANNNYPMQNLQAATVEFAIQDDQCPELVKEALKTRANIIHMSFKKYLTMRDAVMWDGRIRGTLMYHVASTGRFGGRLLQPQNLTRGTIDSVEAVSRIQKGEFSVELVKSAVRGMIYHPEGFTIVDYSGIEARITQWLSMDEEALEVFRQGKDPYIWMAAKIFMVAEEDITKDQRFVGKQAILGLGFQMSAKKFIDVCESYGQIIPVEKASLAIMTYRKTHRNTVKLWNNMQQAAVMAVENPRRVYKVNRYISFEVESNWLIMNLPSGRQIRYFEPELEYKLQSLSISYMSMNSQNQWVRTSTYGGKLLENAVQATARDILVEGVDRLMDHGYTIITHIHDEIVTLGEHPVETVTSIMCKLPKWATGMPLAAEGFNSKRFKKV